MTYKKVSFIFFIFCILFINRANADTIYIDNGDILSGRIISMENNICIFETKYNPIDRINTNNLVGIETDNNYVGELSSGEKIKMRFTYNSVNKTTAHTDYGDIKINPQNLVSLIRVIDTKKTSPQPTPAKGAEGRDSEYGTDTKKEAPLDFLIGSTVLLAPGSWQLEFGVNYKKTKPPVPYLKLINSSVRHMKRGALI